MKKRKTLGLNAHYAVWKKLSTNQIAPFSVRPDAETLGLKLIAKINWQELLSNLIIRICAIIILYSGYT